MKLKYKQNELKKKNRRKKINQILKNYQKKINAKLKRFYIYNKIDKINKLIKMKTLNNKITQIKMIMILMRTLIIMMKKNQKKNQSFKQMNFLKKQFKLDQQKYKDRKVWI